MAARAKKSEEQAEIKPPNMCEMAILIRGTAPLVIHRFWKKAELEMDMELGDAGKKGKRGKRPARDYDNEYEQSKHVSTEGWCGIAAVAFRAAMIDACRLAGIPMTRAKMIVFVLADGFDKNDQTQLVRITKGDPFMHTGAVRNANGQPDIRSRPMWTEWEARPRILFNADIISAENVVNLLSLAGMSVGVGEGRPYSKNSVGQGWGTWEVVSE